MRMEIEFSNGNLVTFAGGIPLRSVDGQIIGSIGVSGGQVAQDYAVAQSGESADEQDDIPIERNENFYRWRCLMPDTCFEGQQFLAFRGSVPAKGEALPRFPSHLVRPCETLGTTTSHQTLRQLWDPRHLVTPFETLGTATSR